MQRKNNNLWFLSVFFIVGLTLLISLSPWLAELFATPPDRIFSGINRWSTDYYVYLSYVELGKRALLPVWLLTTTVPYPGIYAHLVYTIPGYIFGHILNFNAVLIYHLFRSVYGLGFLIAVVGFFYRLTKNRLQTLLAFILAFYISGFATIQSFFPLVGSRSLSWMQEQNIIGRASGPLHYNAGFIFFILSFLYYFKNKNFSLKKIFIFGFLLNLTIFANPFAYLILGLSFGLYVVIKSLSGLKNLIIFMKNEVVVIVGGFVVSLPAFLYFNYHLARQPWGPASVSPQFYTVTTPPISLKEVIFSVGPILILGTIGLVAVILKKITSGLSRSQTIFLGSWLIVQFTLVLFGNQLKVHPPRAFSGLYYLPLALFSAILIFNLARRHLFVVLASLVLLFLMTSPDYYFSYKELLYAFTDFKSFQPFSYPTKSQVDAFRFLETQTPARSGVLAMFEASSLIPAFSANATELGMMHQTKILFYSNQMSPDSAVNFLKTNRFQYVYFGYQERSVGGNPGKYPFLKKIFKNSEASIYKVIF